MDKFNRSEIAYPQNIQQDMLNLKTFMQENHFVEVNLVEHRKSITIQTQRSSGIDYTFYYIPIKPYFILNENGSSLEADLLIGIYSYLKNVLGVPFYMDKQLEQTCNEILDCAMEDAEHSSQDDVEELNNYVAELQKEISLMDSSAEIILPLIQIPKKICIQNLILAIDQLRNANPSHPLIPIAEKFIHHHNRYRGKSLRSVMGIALYEENEPTVYFEQYLSFVHTNCGNSKLSASICDHINSTIEQVYQFETPTDIQLFSTPQKTIKNYNRIFADRTLTIINELITYLTLIENTHA